MSNVRGSGSCSTSERSVRACMRVRLRFERSTVSAINAINWIRVPAGLWNRYN